MILLSSPQIFGNFFTENRLLRTTKGFVRHFGRFSIKHLSGVDVMITIYCDFTQFSVKKFSFFLNTNVMLIFSKFGFVLSQKTPIFSLNFSAKIFSKIGPW
jgi:hypothetical protein